MNYATVAELVYARVLKTLALNGIEGSNPSRGNIVEMKGTFAL